MSSYYESDRAVAEYLLFHYGEDDLRMPWAFGPRDGAVFPARCVSECLRRELLPAAARALDLGCAVGRATFELARACGEVIGVDFSRRFIAAANRLRREGSLAFEVLVEGETSVRAVARVPAGVDPARVGFETGDALDLRPDLGDFDVVLAANLLDRVPRPRGLLQACDRLVRPGGQLILTSPYTWLEEYTPREEWLGRGGRRTSEVLAAFLPGFRLVHRGDLPFVLREHGRKFQWSVAEATVWQRA